jgi:DNA-binding HxlR family transcriptional regulator
VGRERTGTAYDAGCPAREVLELIARQWTVLVVDASADGATRYNELRRMTTGVSQKTLTPTPRQPERKGMPSAPCTTPTRRRSTTA